MSDQTRQQLQQALELLKSGQRDQARTLLESIVKVDPDNANAWWMMATAVTAPMDMRNALQNVVRINPDYPNAQQMLDRVNAQLNTIGGAATTATSGVGSTNSTVPSAPTAPSTPAPITTVPITTPSATVTPLPTAPINVVPTVPTTPSMLPPAPPSSSSGSQIGESLDDLFTPLSAGSTPSYSSNAPTGPTGPTYTPPAYVPPPAPPPKKGRSPLLYVLIGLVIAVVCVCGGCIAITGGSIFAVVNNPTVKAAIGTSFTMFGAPDKLPADAINMGKLDSNKSQTGQLKLLERHVWTYDGQSDEQIDIMVTATSGNAPPYIGIYDKNGNLVARTNLGTPSARTQTLSATLSEDATYSILVGGLAGNATNYTIKVNSTSRQ